MNVSRKNNLKKENILPFLRYVLLDILKYVGYLHRLNFAVCEKFSDDKKYRVAL